MADGRAFVDDQQPVPCVDGRWRPYVNDNAASTQPLLPFTSPADELLEVIGRALRSARGRTELVTVTGASNVTGEVWPITQITQLAHRYGAEVFVDAAQLAPHRSVSMTESGIDYLGLSGHKRYAPFGAGALVARAGTCEPRSTVGRVRSSA